MLKPQDLNIGNVVSLYGAENNWTTICDICSMSDEIKKFLTEGGIEVTEQDTHYVIVGNEKYRTIALLRYVVPITLTPKLLEQCALDMRKVNEHFVIYQNTEKDRWALAFLGKKVEYFHQLQNIYHILKEEELQWNGR